jgi:hypothetical protein
VTAGLGRSFGARGELTLGLRVGLIADGKLREGGRVHDFEPGIVGALALDWRVLTAPDDPLTLTLGVQLAAGHARLVHEGVARSWTSTDVRASVTISRTLWRIVTPYLSARVFGGPIFWRDTTGTDKTHLQLALGLAIEPVAGFTLHVEGALLSERGLSGGIGVSF